MLGKMEKIEIDPMMGSLDNPLSEHESVDTSPPCHIYSLFIISFSGSKVDVLILYSVYMAIEM